MTDDMHQHRRSTDTDDMHGHRLQAAADSTAARVMNRLVSPVVGIMLTIIGFFLARSLNDVADAQRLSAEKAEAQSQDLAQLKSDVRVITTRIDEGVIRQVNAYTQQVADHERRIQAIERAVPTP